MKAANQKHAARIRKDLKSKINTVNDIHDARDQTKSYLNSKPNLVAYKDLLTQRRELDSTITALKAKIKEDGNLRIIKPQYNSLLRKLQLKNEKLEDKLDEGMNIVMDDARFKRYTEIPNHNKQYVIDHMAILNRIEQENMKYAQDSILKTVQPNCQTKVDNSNFIKDSLVMIDHTRFIKDLKHIYYNR